MQVSVIIPNYNGAKLIEENLPSVFTAQKNRKNKIREIIVVDDSSIDDSVKIIKEKFPKVRLIKHRINRGFSTSVNIGVRMANSDLACILNNDVSVSKNFLEKALGLFEKPIIFAVSLHEKGFGYSIGKFIDGFIVFDSASEKKTPTETFRVNGGSGIFRRSIWIKLRGMDETILSPFYWEDQDICYRAVKRGYKLLWEPRSLVIHDHESTINERNFSKNYLNLIKERNQLLFIWKNLTSPILFRKHIRGLFNRTKRHPGYLKIVFAALLKLREVRKARKIETKESTVSDEAIFEKFSK